MQIVINIPEQLIELAQKELIMGGDMPTIANAISNGVVLPKRHGRIVDVDDISVIELEDSLHIIRHEKGDDVDVYIDAPTIIEADKGE